MWRTSQQRVDVASTKYLCDRSQHPPRRPLHSWLCAEWVTSRCSSLVALVVSSSVKIRCAEVFSVTESFSSSNLWECYVKRCPDMFNICVLPYCTVLIIRLKDRWRYRVVLATNMWAGLVQYFSIIVYACIGALLYCLVLLQLLDCWRCNVVLATQHVDMIILCCLCCLSLWLCCHACTSVRCSVCVPAVRVTADVVTSYASNLHVDNI